MYKGGRMKKVLTIIGGIVVGLIVLGIAIYFFVSLTSNKLVCKSSLGKITIMYNDKELTGYKTTGMSYQFDNQKEYAKKIGVDNYIEEFKEWFIKNTEGTCEKK